MEDKLRLVSVESGELSASVPELPVLRGPFVAFAPSLDEPGEGSRVFVGLEEADEALWCGVLEPEPVVANERGDAKLRPDELKASVSSGSLLAMFTLHSTARRT